jgi:putative pyruvate formate lyase activating enzyme
MKSSILEMHRQVGDLVVEHGLAVRGLIIRHLVLPDRLAGTEEIMEFIARQISDQSYVNVMAQYHPCGEIVHESNESQYHVMTRRTTPGEYREAVDIARSKGLWRGIYSW